MFTSILQINLELSNNDFSSTKANKQFYSQKIQDGDGDGNADCIGSRFENLTYQSKAEKQNIWLK